MGKNELSKILEDKLAITPEDNETLTIHLFFIEYVDELKSMSRPDIIEMLIAAGRSEKYYYEYLKMRKIAQHVTLKASYPPR